VNMILNERFDGMRFWNLLKMMYVDVEGKQYIIGIQTTVDSYMPPELRLKSDDKAVNEQIMQTLDMFNVKLKLLRTKLDLLKQTSFTELWMIAHEELVKMQTTETAPQQTASAKAAAAKAASKSTLSKKSKSKPAAKYAEDKKETKAVDVAPKPLKTGADPVLEELLASLGVSRPIATKAMAGKTK